MRSPVRSLLAICLVLAFALPSVAHAEGERLHVTPPAETRIPADGKSTVALQIELHDAKGAPLAGKKVVATTTDEVDILTQEAATLENGKASILVRAREKTGRAKVVVKGEGQGAEAAILLEEPPGKVDLAGTFARLGLFFVTMMLISLGAEKAVDLGKIVLTAVAGARLRPKPRLSEYVEKNRNLLSMPRADLATLHRLMRGVPAPDDCKDDELRARIAEEDAARDRVETIWTTGMRLGAAGVGILLAYRFGIDAFEFVAPLGVKVSGDAGKVLTGVGAAAGAAFWQDLFDRMTDAKKKLPEKV